jgi:hypothetical protein
MADRASSVAKWLFVPLVWSVAIASILELTLPLLNRKFAVYFKRSIAPSAMNAEKAERFAHSRTFDPDLGWNDVVARNYVATKSYLAQAYGDSFVRGDGVGDEDSWEAHFERITGDSIMNSGVGGYGLDQAVLKFEKYGRRYPTRIAVLGLYPEMYRRDLSYHSFYYFPNNEAFAFAFKPLFVRTNEHFELIRPPCKDAACLMKVFSSSNHDVWRRVAKYDYWYRVNEQKPEPGFPNTIKYAQVLRELARERREHHGQENYFFVTAGALELSQYLIQRFADDSRQMGMMPVCVLLYSADDLRVIKSGVRFDAALLKFLAAKGIPYIDTAQYILVQYRDNDRFEGLSVSRSDRHLSCRGNFMVAEALARGLGSLALLDH